MKGKKCNLNLWWNNDKCWRECKKHHICEKRWYLESFCMSFKSGKYLASIIVDSVITCNKIIDNQETKTIPTNFNEKNITCKTQNFYILIAFLLITIALLMAVSIYCYLIKYWAKQKHLLPFHVVNNELR